MERNGSSGVNRRELLAGVGAAAVATPLLAGSAGATHCHYEYWCLNGYQLRRHCCEDPDTGEIECTNWQKDGSC